MAAEGWRGRGFSPGFSHQRRASAALLWVLAGEAVSADSTENTGAECSKTAFESDRSQGRACTSHMPGALHSSPALPEEKVNVWILESSSSHSSEGH